MPQVNSKVLLRTFRTPRNKAWPRVSRCSVFLAVHPVRQHEVRNHRLPSAAVWPQPN